MKGLDDRPRIEGEAVVEPPGPGVIGLVRPLAGPRGPDRHTARSRTGKGARLAPPPGNAPPSFHLPAADPGPDSPAGSSRITTGRTTVRVPTRSPDTP